MSAISLNVDADALAREEIYSSFVARCCLQDAGL